MIIVTVHVRNTQCAKCVCVHFAFELSIQLLHASNVSLAIFIYLHCNCLLATTRKANSIYFLKERTKISILYHTLYRRHWVKKVSMKTHWKSAYDTRSHNEMNRNKIKTKFETIHSSTCRIVGYIQWFLNRTLNFYSHFGRCSNLIRSMKTCNEPLSEHPFFDCVAIIMWQCSIFDVQQTEYFQFQSISSLSIAV